MHRFRNRMFRGPQQVGACAGSLILQRGARCARRLRLAVVLLVPLLISAGCNRGAYRAAKLPQAYLAPVVHSAQHLDLSRLSHSSQQNEVVYPGDLVSVSLATGLELRGAGTLDAAGR